MSRKQKQQVAQALKEIAALLLVLTAEEFAQKTLVAPTAPATAFQDGNAEYITLLRRTGF
jgi:hypothetical protein